MAPKRDIEGDGDGRCDDGRPLESWTEPGLNAFHPSVYPAARPILGQESLGRHSGNALGCFLLLFNFLSDRKNCARRAL